MIGFALKKAFFDLWDHLVPAIVINIMHTVVFVTLVSLVFLLTQGNFALLLAFVPVPLIVVMVAGGAINFWARDIVVAGHANRQDFLSYFGQSWRQGLAFALGLLVLAAGALFGLPFYHQLGLVIGILFQVLLLWLIFFGFGGSLYFPGVGAQQLRPVVPAFKRALLLFVTHPLVSLGVAALTLLMIALTLATVGFFPGVAGIALWLQVCTRFLTAKLDWLAENPGADRKHVPWAQVLADDMDRVGPRSLRGMFFPWKD